jgi:creatinine amidohydrolase/Fe(II)-dependent formamide hydrolase-like protein
LIRLAECTWPEAEALAHDERALVVLPLGAIEQHGPHLPLLVDWLGAEELARRIAPHLTRAGYRVVLAPALPYGASPLAERWPGTVSLSRATLVSVIVEVVQGLARHGFRRFVLANYQADGEHLRAMAEARRRLRGLHVLFAGFSPDAGVPSPMMNPRVRALMKSPRPDLEWHSGELETALMLARRPDLVRQKLVRALPPAWVDFRAALARGARRFEDIAPGGAGYFGWPAAARARTAERAMRLRAELIARALLTELRRSSSKRSVRRRVGNAPSRTGGSPLGAR